MVWVLIVEDHFLVREGLKQLISHDYPAARFGEAATVRQALLLLPERPWNLVLLDIGLPDGDGLSVLERARRDRPESPVLIVTGHSGQLFAEQAREMGAAGFVRKSAEGVELGRAIHSVLAGSEYFTRRSDTAKSAHSLLSPQEFKVMLAIAAGKRPSDIAREADLSTKTISTYKRRVFAKLGLKSTAELIRFISDGGLD